MVRELALILSSVEQNAGAVEQSAGVLPQPWATIIAAVLGAVLTTVLGVLVGTRQAEEKKRLSRLYSCIKFAQA